MTAPAGQLVPPEFSDIAVSEHVTLQSATLNGVPLTPEQMQQIQQKQGPGATNSNSQIVDQLHLRNASGNPLPSGLVIVSSQELLVASFSVRFNTIEQRSENVVIITNLGPMN